MAEIIDYTLQDSNVLLKTIYNRVEEMKARGFDETKSKALTAAHDELIVKDTAQKKAITYAEDKTAELKSIENLATSLIKKLKNAVKSAYEEEPRKLKLFLIGEAIPLSVKALSTKLRYYIDILPEHNEVLLKNGMIQSDLDSFNTLYNSLLLADSEQDKANKAQVAATKARNDAMKNLQKKMKTTRSFAKACFAENPDILVEFEPVSKGRNIAKENDKGNGTETKTTEVTTEEQSKAN